MTTPSPQILQRDHCERCLDEHGDTHRGVDWSSAQAAETRYEVMMGLIKPHPGERVSLLDFGCGASALLAYLRDKGVEGIDYTGLDISEKFLALSRAKFPGVPYIQMDFLQPEAQLGEYDYVVVNGLFTNKGALSFETCFDYAQTLLRKLWPHARRGLAFNAMTKHVDWEREDLFHLPFDSAAAFLKRDLSRNIVIRQDYGTYDFTVYVYR